MTVTPRTGSRIEELLARSGRFFIPGEISADLRTVTRRGGRDGDVFYRDRWSHHKVVRSTHGVNCTGSCSWKIYVKDGIITWETQETDYPSVGPDRPEYEPRGCPRGAAFSWYTYSPTRVRHPYARGVLVEMYREAKARLGDPVAAWADIQADPRRRRRYQRARGKGGLVRVSWAEATEMIAAAHVHTISTYGPDRVAGFSPIPAMSMVSHAAGSRFVELIGGVMTSFYDWYADLPVASPQVFGDQTDVPESGDWWDVVWQCASVLLTYPNSRQLGTAEELLAHIDGPAADLLGRTVSELRRADPLTAATRYVDTFDLRGRATLYLTYWTAGDTRNRGREMLAFAQTYRSTDVAPPRGETPDFLPVVLEFAATVDPEAGRRLLSGYRVPIAALCNALTEAALPYAHTVAAVCRTGDMMGELFWTVVPYVTMTIVAVGSWWRYRYDKFGWTTRSSQLYESRLLRIASPMFHFGILVVIVGHGIGLVIPQSWTQAAGLSEGAYHVQAVVLGSIAGITTLAGVTLLIYRRRTRGPVFMATTVNDKVMYLVLVAAIVAGLGATALGSGVVGEAYNYRETVSVWFRSVWVLQPRGDLMAEAPLYYQIHVLIGLALFALWPFTRLVHAFSAPIGYLFRPYIIYRSREELVLTRPRRRGW
ncbi:respiratory nitrate reductase subunit gamma [Mycobacterium tuberculosis]|uniref:Nitrate reductase-like protein NarX n=5 Tax=Mycobacterium tuberculosis TaxID=1773 RepID=A0A1R3XZ78_MYCBO|nr:respiratory nitrate reductase subunit gamma [Mycobacterium tuberculosis]AHM07470.1 Respiratory nitrate reductase gamma chain [Mycobacterium tuberculosis variant bovis BCG str. ATCC 35743]MBA2790302.1 respiratory nitrate reductase subunit gamma [Mycobacterium canetti]AAF22229.1 fused nitrate reductase [Mycobacterium tuberculosis variant bovis BCG]AET19028.1 Putative nitrate reductase [Mycobacterium tuberculosis variant bovis BCG str. Mexico]AGE67735.1 nitrate reductase NarX [Mycobacterium tu